MAKFFEPDYLWLLNNDTIIQENSLEILVDFLNDNEDYAGVSPLIMNYYERDKIWSAGGTISWFGGLSKNLNFKSIKNLKDNYIEVNFITHCASFYRFSMIDENPLPSNNWADDDFEYCINLLNLPYKLACKTDSIIFHKIGQTYKLEDNPNYDNISVIGNVYGDYLAHLITIKNFYSLPILFYWIIINSVKFFYQVVINNRKNIITGFILLFKLLKDSLKFNEYNRIVNYRAINIYK